MNRFDLRTGRLPWTVAVGGLTLAVTISSALIADAILVESSNVSVVVIAAVVVVRGGLLPGAVQLLINRRLRLLIELTDAVA